MLASQLLYTSWKNGNSTTKGYMVYSKSRDITDVEENEICAVMKYKAPDNLPYTPTNEEIETLFPKIFAYFKLSSGRFCIAQSSYIGQDYTNRWGNYIIHAYVFNDIGDLVPSRMIGADIFRTRLTDEELNADSAPESLPHVDIEYSGNALTEQEIKQFFDTPSKRETLKALAQSACDAISNNKHISFADALINMRMWITTLSMIVPKNILNQVYFSTYTTETSDLITLSCKQITDSSSAYAQTYIPNDLICIDATRNDNNAITIGCYIDAVCNKLLEGYYEGILCTNSVNKSMEDYGCNNYDLAYKLTYVQKGELDYISSNDELLSIIDLLAKHGAENLTDTFGKIFFQYSSSEMYTGDPSSIAVFKVLYPHLSAESKADLLMMYVEKKLENNSDATSVYAEIKRDCPCAWNEAVMHFLRQSFKEHFGQHLSNAAALLLCNSWITVYQRCSEDQQQRAGEQISSLYAKLVASRDTQAILCVLDSCKNVDEQLYSAVYKSVCKTIERFGEDDNYLFDYLKLALDKGNLFWAVLLHELNRSPALEQQYIKHFIALQNESSAQVSNLMRYADKNPPIRQFVDNVNVYAFERTQTDSFDGLVDCYTKYIANSMSSKETTDRCRTIFAQKVRMFLRNCDLKESIKYSISLYDNLYRGRELVEADKDTLSLLSDTIYNDNQKDIAFIIKCLSKTPFETIIAFMNSCQSAGIPVHQRALLMYEGHLLTRAAERDGKSAKRQVQQKFDDNRFAFLSKSCTGNLLKEFLDSYMDVMLKGMYTIYKENDNNLSAPDLIDYFLMPISKSYSSFEEDILQAWREDVGVTNENMDMYFLYIFDKTSAFRNELKDVVEEYLVRIGKGKRNALFDELTAYFGDLEDVSYSKKMDRYIKEFNKNHVSFWDKIKSIFSVKEEDRGNGKKK